MKPQMLKPALAAFGAAISLAAIGAAQDNTNIEDKVRDLNIMEKIFEAAMEEGRGRDRGSHRVGSPDSMYLAGQGMVFSFRLANYGFGFFGNNASGMVAIDLNEMMAQTRASLERVQASFPDLDFDFDFDVDFDENNNNRYRYVYRGNQAAPQAPQAPVVFIGNNRGPEREAMQEMEEAMRETQEEIRDLQREIRSMEREIRNANESAERDRLQARIDSQEAAVDAQMAGLESQQEAYQTFINDLQETRRGQQLALANEAASQIISTLCDYGSSLRSLDNNEHVTIILQDVIDDTDQVYVFNYRDISDCTSADSLKQKAVSYEMRGL